MYRPTNFESVMGQEIAVRLLKNALKQDKLPKCLIFYGPSGVGKTTLARLIAAWSVCLERKEDDVCGECQMCKAVQKDAVPDIFEFDAASHTSIEDVREILEMCSYAPQFSKEKVFIIDEAHMLSRNAIAALLKTFEEGIPHVRFILATTEIEKISNAIRSRCFAVPLKEMKLESIKQYIKKIAEEEGVSVDDASLEIIHDLSYGSMREALSIFNRAKMLNHVITPEVMESILAFARKEEIEELAKLVLKGNFVQTYEKLVYLIEQKDVAAVSLLKQIISYFRKEVPSVSGAEKGKYLKIMIDLNNLQHQILKLSVFSEAIIIGVTKISYDQQ